MAKLPGLFQRNGVWTLRVMTPLELQPSYEGRSKIIESLKTGDYDKAKRLATAWRADLLEEFERKRIELNPQRVERVTPQMAQLLAERVRVRVLSGDERLRSGDPQGQALVGAFAIIQEDSPLKINRKPSPRPARPPFDPLDGMPLAHVFFRCRLLLYTAKCVSMGAFWRDPYMDTDDLEKAIAAKLEERKLRVLNKNAIGALFGMFPKIDALRKIFVGRGDALAAEEVKIKQDIMLEMVCRIDAAISGAIKAAEERGVSFAGLVEVENTGSGSVIGVHVTQQNVDLTGSRISLKASGSGTSTGLKIGQ